MEEKENSKAVKAVTLKLTPEVYTKYKQLEAEIDAATVSNFIETIIERVYSPIRINQENEQKIRKQLEGIEHLEDKLLESEKKLQESFREIEKAQKENEQLSMEMERTKNEITIPDNCLVVKFDALNIKILQYVAARESKKRNQNWSVDDVINYFTHFRFEMGSLNGDLDSIPDKIIEQLKKEL